MPAPLAAAAEPTTNSLGMHFVRIEPGIFEMGASADDHNADADEQPRHSVRVTRPFYIGRHEVTQREYKLVTGENPSWFAPTGGGRDDVRGVATDALPVDMVSWDEAVEFCRRLSALPKEREAGRVYRLPTEAEWEFAAQGAVEPTASATTRPVGSTTPSISGVYDLRGNVWEWCSDHYDADYYRRSPVADPPGPAEGTGRVVRGGDFRSTAAAARITNRDFTRATRRDLGNGFRVVLEMGRENGR